MDCHRRGGPSTALSVLPPNGTAPASRSRPPRKKATMSFCERIAQGCRRAPNPWLVACVFLFAWNVCCTLLLFRPDEPLRPDGPLHPDRSPQEALARPAKDTIVEELYRSVSPKRLAQLARTHREHYSRAQPFPHIAIDRVFPDAILQQVVEEHPESSLGSNGCLKESLCFKEKTQNLKSAIDREERMGTYTRVLFSFLKSSVFTTFPEELTGIQDIIPDPHFRGSGLHFTGPGGNLNVHADFNKYAKFNLDRRVNVFIYLNNDWPDEYGGHLDLWSRDMRTCHERIPPAFGRFVVFSSTDFSYHGHPEPITAPRGRARRSVALYYYSNGRPRGECLNNDCSGTAHSTLFQTPVGCERCLDATCRRESTLSPPTWLADFI